MSSLHSKALTVLDPSMAQKEAEAHAQDGAGVLAAVRDHVEITDEVSYQHATDVVKQLKARWNALEAKRKEWTAPLNGVVKSINASFADALEPLTQAERLLKQRIAVWHSAQEQKRVDAMRELAAAGVAGRDAQATILVPTQPDAKGIGVRKVLKARIVDADRVPRLWCSPDMAKIQAHIDRGGLDDIPGVEIYEDAIVSVRVK